MRHLPRNGLSMNGKKALPVWSTCSGFWVSSHCPSIKKMRILEGSGSNSSGEEPQDADYHVPCLSDEIETLILARVPRSEYWKFSFVNRRFWTVLKSGEIYKIRREIGFKEPSVFMLASGESNWWAFDRHFKSPRKLPVVLSDYTFEYGDKESVSAGTHLLVSGMESGGAVVWRYELTTNEWIKSDPMLSPRCLFASATCGNFAFVAGGLDTITYREVLDTAERYNSESKSWEPLPSMKQKRKFCSGCYMDNKFYVIGGKDEQQNDLTCGEFFDEETNTWHRIPDMLQDIPVPITRSPPLVAVANNELYTLDASSNELKVYLKKSNSWKKLGAVPVRANAQGGWGVAFKSLGNELLVIGANSVGRGLSIYTCSPDPAVEKLLWKQIECSSTKLHSFVHNCAVMIA